MKNKYYAYIVPHGEKGVTPVWEQCKRAVSGKSSARFKGFSTEKEAVAWLDTGAKYEARKPLHRYDGDKPTHVVLEKGIYFDSGTGRGLGLVEIKVTDKEGRSILGNVLKPSHITKHGTHLITRRTATNNYGELLACCYALKISLKEDVKKIFGDSKLVIDYWSKGRIKAGVFPKAVYALVDDVAALRREFEERGGSISHISGDHNPADLGFHK